MRNVLGRMAGLAVLGLLLPLLASSSASACSCVGPGAPCEAYGATPAVFACIVTEISPSQFTFKDGDQERTYPCNLVRFRIERAYKGVELSESVLRTGRGGGDCGFEFTVDEHYLVYAHRDPGTGELGTSICSRTQRLADAGDDLAYIASLSDSSAKGRIRGTLSLYRGTEYPPSEAGSNAPIAGVRVRIEGGARWRGPHGRGGTV
jgi:hypothetical protein